MIHLYRLVSKWPLITTGLLLTSVLMGLLGLLDGYVIQQLSRSLSGDIDLGVIELLVGALLLKNVGVMILYFFQKKIGFRLFEMLSIERMREFIQSRRNDSSAQNGNVSFITNEPLQLLLTVIFPLCSFISASINVLLIGLVSSLVLPSELISLVLIFIIAFVLYFYPVSLYLKKRGVVRHKGDADRVGFCSLASVSKDELAWSKYGGGVVDKYFVCPTKSSSAAIGAKWFQGEIQKNMVEIVALVSITIWLFFLTELTMLEALGLLAPLAYVAFRVLPLINRMMVNLQSINFGLATVTTDGERGPVSYDEVFSIEVSDDGEAFLEINSIKLVARINLEKCGIHIIRGASGCGKTTLLSEMGRYLSLNSEAPIAYLSQVPLILNNTLLENIDVEKRGASITELLNRMNLSNVNPIVDILNNRKISTQSVSGGEAKRIALARVIYSDARIVLLDEPTAGLDSRSKAIINKLLLELAETRVIVIVSHEDFPLKENLTKEYEMNNG